MADKLVTGIVTGVHGRSGELKVKPESGENKHFYRLKNVSLNCEGKRRDFAVESIRKHNSFALVKLQTIDSAEQAAEFIGWELLIPRRKAARRKRGEYYTADICSCSVQNGKKTVGTVLSVWDSGANDMLEIQKNDGSIVMVPFLKKFVGKVNLRKKSIELKNDWILS
jgi:16S rRNA processing protein RimM